MEDNEFAPEGPPPPPPLPIDDDENENNNEDTEETDKFPVAPVQSSSISARAKQVGGRSLLVTRTNSSFDEIDGGGDNDGAVLAYGTAVVKSDATAVEKEECMQATTSSKSTVTSTSTSESAPKRGSKGSLSETKTTLQDKSMQSTSTSATSTTEVRLEQQRQTSTTIRDASTASTSAAAAANVGSATGAQVDSEPVQRRVSKSRARFQIESRMDSRQDSGDDPSLSELKTQLDEYRDRIAETDARIRRAMEEREQLIEHLLQKLQAQYPGSEKEEGSSVQLVQMCATLASAGKQLAAVQDTSDWAVRKRSLSRLLGSTCSMMPNRMSTQSANASCASAGAPGAADLEADRPLTSTRVSLPQLQKGIEALKRSIELLTAAEKRQNGENLSRPALAQTAIAK